MSKTKKKERKVLFHERCSMVPEEIRKPIKKARWGQITEDEMFAAINKETEAIIEKVYNDEKTELQNEKSRRNNDVQFCRNKIWNLEYRINNLIEELFELQVDAYPDMEQVKNVQPDMRNHTRIFAAQFNALLNVCNQNQNDAYLRMKEIVEEVNSIGAEVASLSEERDKLEEFAKEIIGERATTGEDGISRDESNTLAYAAITFMFRDPEAAKSYKKYMSSRKICKKTINACLIRMGLGTIKDMDRMVKYVMDPTSCRDPLVRRIEKEAMMK